VCAIRAESGACFLNVAHVSKVIDMDPATSSGMIAD
jgi:hypothetical protein